MRIFFESDLAEFIYEGKPLFSWIIEIMNQLIQHSKGSKNKILSVL